MNNIPIKLYKLSTCIHCNSLKKFLEEHKVEFEFIDIDLLEKKERKATMKDLRRINPKGSLPTIQIGDQVVVGFKEDEIKEALEK
jgi:glutaredoxin-like protein NrdH